MKSCDRAVIKVCFLPQMQIKMLRITLSIFLAISGYAAAASLFGNRIIGGNTGDIIKFPYQLSLRSYGSHICGASIISKNWALTAAQCVDGVRDISSVTLLAASNNLNGDGHIHEAAEIIQHPDYDIVYKANDLALIRVEESFHIGEEEDIVQLPNKDEQISAGELCTITGWGFTAEGGHLSESLQSVQVPIMAQQECQTDYSDRNISDRLVCAGFAQGGQDFCDGDTGGPLVYKGKQIGIASWGHGCAQANAPGVYTRVAAFRDWINRVTDL